MQTAQLGDQCRGHVFVPGNQIGIWRRFFEEGTDSGLPGKGEMQFGEHCFAGRIEGLYKVDEGFLVIDREEIGAEQNNARFLMDLVISAQEPKV